MQQGATPSGSVSRLLVGSLIASLCVAAAVAIGAIVADQEIDDTTARILGSVLALTVYSLTALPSNSVRARRADLTPLGEFGLVSSVIGFGAALVAIWIAQDSEAAWQGEGLALTITLALAHSALLLRSPTDRLSVASRLIRGATVAATTVLAGLICVQILAADLEMLDWRVIAVVAVLFLLGNVVFPLVRLLEPRR